MKKLRINIVLPFPATRPGGGVKIMYEYANRLRERGHLVTVLHSIRRPFKKMRSPLWWKLLNYKLRRAERPDWFPLHPAIRSVIVPEITDKYLPDADVTMSTWWEMAYMVRRLNPSKGRPFNLVQDYEIWKGNQELVHATYRLPIHHLVIARYLQELIEKHSGKQPVHIPNAIDTEKFFIEEPIESREEASVIMLYSKEPRKGSAFGIEALLELKKLVPALRATLFGVFAKPSLPDWIDYQQKPADLRGLYNAHAIFFSPSLGEGWALPPAEAMACGCAVVCTDIGGHADYAKDGETALLVEAENVPSMVSRLHQLISNPERRMVLAKNGNAFIHGEFSWTASVDKLEKAFYDAVNRSAS